jgi:DhnA family fructose-bisphosphate aldolase class Ia
MVSRLPLYKEAAVTEKVDAYLERDGVHVPLQLCVDTTDADEEAAHLHTLAAALEPGAIIEQPLPNDMRDVPADVARRATFTVPIAREDEIVDRRVTPGAGPAVAAVAEAVAAVAAVQSALPDAETMAAISRIVAAVERFGVPALVSSYPMSQAEAAQRLRGAPPRLTPADEAAFAAAARDLPLKGSPWPTSRSS